MQDPLETNHLVVCCDTGQLTFEARFWACYTRLSTVHEKNAT